MLPEGNNVCGTITAPQGLQPVLRALGHLVDGGRAYIYRSQFNRAETLHLRSEAVDFDSDQLDDGIQHSFSGGVGGSMAEVVGFVRALSDALQTAGVEHRFEIYDEDQRLVQVIPP